MSQHDLTIANQGFPAFRADLNDALQALGSMQSGTSAPATTFANMLWYDTTNNIVKMRNEDNDAWISLFTLDQSGDLLSAISAATGSFGALSATGNVTLGDSSSDTVTVKGATTFETQISAPNTFGFKNRIINGAMVIDQRNAGAAVTLNSSALIYTADRWAFGWVGSAAVGSAVRGSGQLPFSRYAENLTITTASTPSGNQTYNFQQRIEGFNVADLLWGTASAASVTLSFKVQSSLTGTFSGALQNAAQNRSYPFTYTISTANTPTNISVTIAGDTTGTWATDNTTGIGVAFDLGGAGSARGTAGAWAAAGYYGATGSVNLVATLNATWQISEVQLEKGSTATSFDYRPYGTELALCQRYYSNTTFRWFTGYATDTSNQINCQQTPAPMRAGPTVSIVSSDSNTNVASLVTVDVTPNNVNFSVTPSVAGWWRIRILSMNYSADL